MTDSLVYLLGDGHSQRDFAKCTLIKTRDEERYRRRVHQFLSRSCSAGGAEKRTRHFYVIDSIRLHGL